MKLELPSRYELAPTDPILGEGGMGQVWRVRDVVMDVPVALKVVRPELAADERFRKLFDLEVRIAARFSHPHIVPLHDLGVLDDGTPFLGLALADAGSCAVFREDLPDWPTLLRLTLQLLDALAHLHARGVLHRDLKPENILLHRDAEGQRHVWLADLGLANAATVLAKKKGRMEGTPGFMAPEQRMGLPREYGPWTDLFSLGIVLWELITGKLPFGHTRSPINTPLPPLIPLQGFFFPNGLELVLANLLSAEPLSRYDLAADLATELRALGEATIDRDEAKRCFANGLSGPIAGTVAPSVPRKQPSMNSLISASFPSESDPEPEEPFERDDADTAFQFFDDLDEDEPTFQFGVPVWNRPRPGALPAQPPPEVGFGGSARASLPLFALRELPLVARGTVRNQLWDVAREVGADGLARVVLLVGEAGSGKTHLVESVVRALQEGGWAESVTLSYQNPPGNDDGYPGAARSLLRPWNETRSLLEARLQRTYARDRGARDDVALEDAALLSRWCGLLEEGEEPVAAGLGLREVYRFLDARAWRGLGCLVLENAEWAEEKDDGLAIAEALLQTAQDGQERHLLVLATLRSEDLAASDALRAQVAALVEAGAIRVDLPRLDRAGTVALLSESMTLVPKLSERVVERCEGNPLFARQLLIAWANRGWLVDTGGLQFDLAPDVDADAVLPADAEALFRDRVQNLAERSGVPEAFVDAVHLAALSGAAMPASLFEAVAGPELFASLRGSGLWVEQNARLRFDHGLLHQALRAVANEREDAPTLNLRLADAWEAHGDATGEDVHFLVGRHAHAAGSHPRAVEHLLVAAESAWRRGGTKKLSEAAKLAIEACNADRTIKWRAGWARLWLARASRAEGHAQDAAERYFQAYRLFDTLEDPEGSIAALIGMGWSSMRLGKLARAEKRYTEAMNTAKKLGRTQDEADAIAGLAWMEQQKRNFNGADLLFSRVVARLSRLDDSSGVADALLGKAFVARRTGNFEDAEELYLEAAESYQEADDLLGVAQACFGVGAVKRQLRDNEQAEERLREALSTAEELGATQLLMQTRVALGDLARAAGEVDRAEQIYEAQLRWAKREGVFEDEIFALLRLAVVALLQRDLAKMYQRSSEAVKVLETVPGHWLWATYRLVVATYLALRGKPDLTYRWVWSAAELGLDDTVDQDAAFLLTVICNIAHQDRWEKAIRVAGPLAMSQYKRLGRPNERKRIAIMTKQVLDG